VTVNVEAPSEEIYEFMVGYNSPNGEKFTAIVKRKQVKNVLVNPNATEDALALHQFLINN